MFSRLLYYLHPQEVVVISSKNIPTNQESSDEDFTVDAYRELLALAKEKYAFASYDDIPWGKRFLLWRHDCDYSLNRAIALARIEADYGIRSTYFLNPHSEFYNLLERSQYQIVREIIGMGHQIGLHFDAAFHDISNEESLSTYVCNDAALLGTMFEVRPTVFSFHNPLASHLHCENDSYGGLLNCYSRRFKAEVSYCSDSNGYWRFRRLRDVLELATDPCLQVLTHPGWWQEVAMPPRQRIFRSVYGRAHATMADYDAVILAHGRENLSGGGGALEFLRDVLPDSHAMLDFLWMSGQMDTLFVELWRLHESQLIKLCKAALCKEWGVSAREVSAFFETTALAIEGFKLFAGVFGSVGHLAIGDMTETYAEWSSLRTRLLRGRALESNQRLEEGCIFLSKAIVSLADWGENQAICYDGLADLETIGLLTNRKVDGSVDRCWGMLPDHNMHTQQVRRWEQFISEMESVGTGRVVA